MNRFEDFKRVINNSEFNRNKKSSNKNNKKNEPKEINVESFEIVS